MDPNDPAPDLVSILRTLAAYAPPQPQAPQANCYENGDLEEGEYDPATDYNPSQPLLTSSNPDPQSQHPPPNPQQQQQQQQPLPQHPTTPPQPPPPPKPHQTPAPYPSKITTWPPALRHITHLTTTSPTFTPRITHLIHTQHTHERQRWASRLSLLTLLSTRSEKKRKLDSVLNSLGGKIASSEGVSTIDLPVEKELEIFDRKVWRACGEMVEATRRELGRLEVPFFCVEGGLVGEGELRRLQGKMLELLEDLCGEERQEGE